MDEHTNKLKEFLRLGCSDAARSVAAYRLFVELDKDESSNITYKYDKELDVIYFNVFWTKKDQPDSVVSSCRTYVAFTTNDDIRLDRIDRLLERNFNGEQRSSNSSIALAIVESCATIIYYEMQRGITL